MRFILQFSSCQPRDGNGRVWAQDQDTALRVDQFIHALLGKIPVGAEQVIKLHSRRHNRVESFFAQAFQDNILCSLPDGAFFKQNVPCTLRCNFIVEFQNMLLFQFNVLL